MTTVEEKDDVFLRFDELPCPKYDQKVTSNSVSSSTWIHLLCQFLLFFPNTELKGVDGHLFEYINFPECCEECPATF